MAWFGFELVFRKIFKISEYFAENVSFENSVNIQS